MTEVLTDDDLMALAIEEARRAEAHGDVPVGAIVVIGGKIVAQRHNEREAKNDPTAHGELLAVQDPRSSPTSSPLAANRPTIAR